MKRARRYILPLLTLALIAAGAAMPFLVSRVQDSRISDFREDFALNTVNLTIRQDGEASLTLRLIAGEYTSIPWSGQMSMTEQEACAAAMEAAEEMDQYNLLPEGALDYLKSSGGWAESVLLIGEDGASALVWECYWAGDFSFYLMIDDATGKTVHFLTGTQLALDQADVHTLYELWSNFLTDYYSIEIVSASRLLQGYSDKEPVYLFLLQADLKDGLEPCGLELELIDDIAIFNINTLSENDASIAIDAKSMQIR